jgi:hypothetical protein
MLIRESADGISHHSFVPWLDARQIQRLLPACSLGFSGALAKHFLQCRVDRLSFEAVEP